MGQWDIAGYCDGRISGSDRRGLHLASGASILNVDGRVLARRGYARGRHAAVLVHRTYSVQSAFRFLNNSSFAELRTVARPDVRVRRLYAEVCALLVSGLPDPAEPCAQAVTYLLVVYDLDAGRSLRMEEYDDSREALEARYDEEAKGKPRREIVVLGSASVEDMKVTHSKYFAEGGQT